MDFSGPPSVCRVVFRLPVFALLVGQMLLFDGWARHFCLTSTLCPPWDALTFPVPAPAGWWTHHSSSWTLRGSSSHSPACTGPVCVTAPPSAAARASFGVSPSACLPTYPTVKWCRIKFSLFLVHRLLCWWHSIWMQIFTSIMGFS